MLLQHWSASALVCLDIGPLVCLALSALALVCFSTEFDSNQQITWSVYTNAILPIPLFHMQGSSTVQNRRITQRSIPSGVILYFIHARELLGLVIPMQSSQSYYFLCSNPLWYKVEGLLRFAL